MTDEEKPKVEKPEPEPEDDPEEPDKEDAEVEVGTTVKVDPSDIEVRSESKRLIDVRLLPWDTVVETSTGPEMFVRGATVGTQPDGVLLMGLEHEASLGLGSGGRPVLVRRAVGRSTNVWEEDDGPHVTFKVARTQSGDEVLALAQDRIVRNVSVEFDEVEGGTKTVSRGGRRVRTQHRVRLTGTSMTYRPAYGEQAAVLAVRSQQGVIGMTETTEVPVAGADNTQISEALTRIEAREAANQAVLDKLNERAERYDEQMRTQVSIPSHVEDDPPPSKGEWFATVAKLLTGERIPQEQMRALDDVITTDNPGVVPPAYLTELIGVIDASRPFLSTTRRLPTPESGMQIVVPVINQRPTVAQQATEKAEVESTKTLIGTETFNAITLAGAGDLSIQLIKRSSPSFMALWVDLLAEAYAIEAEDEALRALFDATGGVGAGNALNPAMLNLGAAYMASFDAIRRPPDTIWLSTEAIAEFIDAKATTTNQPLYPGLNASATAAGGITGTVSGLRAVHVPALDAHGAYAIVGPSSGFAWAEDGTYTLQADVPSKAGRDVALVGLLWLIPWYPAAFTSWNVAS